MDRPSILRSPHVQARARDTKQRYLPFLDIVYALQAVRNSRSHYLVCVISQTTYTPRSTASELDGPSEIHEHELWVLHGPWMLPHCLRMCRMRVRRS